MLPFLPDKALQITIHHDLFISYHINQIFNVWWHDFNCLCFHRLHFFCFLIHHSISSITWNAKLAFQVTLPHNHFLRVSKITVPIFLILPTASELPLLFLWLLYPLPNDALQSYPAEESPDTLSFVDSSDNLCKENHTKRLISTLLCKQSIRFSSLCLRNASYTICVIGISLIPTSVLVSESWKQHLSSPSYHTSRPPAWISRFFIQFSLQASWIIAVHFKSYLFTGRTFNSFYS